MKKIIKQHLVFIIAILYLVICWVLGHYVLKNEVKEENNGNGVSAEQGNGQGSYEITFEGNTSTNDNPWGITAGYFEMEDEGQCILLTPNTSALISSITNFESIELKYEIHPWVRDSSDGAGVIIDYLDSFGESMGKEQISIDSMADWQSYVIELARYESVEAIEIICNSGKRDNDICDWVILQIK